MVRQIIVSTCYESGGSYVFNQFYVCFLNSAGVMRERQHGDSFSMTDRPPEEFCLSPEAPSDLLSIDLLHKRSEMMNNQILHRFL